MITPDQAREADKNRNTRRLLRIIRVRSRIDSILLLGKGGRVRIFRNDLIGDDYMTGDVITNDEIAELIKEYNQYWSIFPFSPWCDNWVFINPLEVRTEYQRKGRNYVSVQQARESVIKLREAFFLMTTMEDYILSQINKYLSEGAWTMTVAVDEHVKFYGIDIYLNCDDKLEWLRRVLKPYIEDRSLGWKEVVAEQLNMQYFKITFIEQ